MAVFKKVNFKDFVDCFNQHNINKFSSEAYKKMFDYYEEKSKRVGKHVRLDVITICCQWSEYDNYQQVIQDNNLKINLDGLDEKEKVNQVMNLLKGKTIAYLLDNNHILIRTFLTGEKM